MEKTVRRISPSDVGGFLYSLTLVTLAVIGMAGLLYHTLTPKGSINAWLGAVWATHPIFASLVLVGLVAMALTARSQPFSYQHAIGRSDVPLYAFVALGTFFALRLILNGGF